MKKDNPTGGKIIALWGPDQIPMTLTGLKKVAPGLAREYRVKRKMKKVIAERTRQAKRKQQLLDDLTAGRPRLGSFARLCRWIFPRRTQ